MKYLYLTLLLSGCTLSPSYERPDTCAPSEWRVPIEEEYPDCNWVWWEQFGDPLLSDLITQALYYNQDIQAAIYRVDQFVARWGMTRSHLFPQIHGVVNGYRQKISDTQEPIQGEDITTFNNYNVLLKASYELDLWGRYRSQTEAAFDLICAEVQMRRTVVLTVVSMVAKSYIDLKQAEKQLKIAQETLETRVESYDLSVIRFDLGLTSEMQVQQAKSEVESAQAEINRLTVAIALQEDLLSFLTGMPPTGICGGKILDELNTPAPPHMLPCDVVQQRPDILAQEQKLKAANAEIGVARSLFFPQVTLGGEIGTETSFFKELFDGPSSVWLYGAELMQEIFTGGRLTSGVYLSESLKRELIHTYRSSVLNAFKEVTDALIAHNVALNQVRVQKERVDTLSEYLRLSNLRYSDGLTDYLTVLDAERHLFAAQLDYAQAQGESLTTLVDLYQTTGGGWVCDADSMALSSQCRD